MKYDLLIAIFNLNNNIFIAENPSSFKNYTSTKEPVWKELLSLVTHFIQKQNTVMREDILPKTDAFCDHSASSYHFSNISGTTGNDCSIIWNVTEFFTLFRCIGLYKFSQSQKEGSKFKNCKATESIVLSALANYKFLFVDIGRNGRTHDSIVFRTSLLGRKFFFLNSNQNVIVL